MAAIEIIDVTEAHNNTVVKHDRYNLRPRTIVRDKAPYNLRHRTKRQVETDYAQHNVRECRVKPQLQDTDLQCEDDAAFYAEMNDFTFKEIKKRMCSTPKTRTPAPI